MTTDVQQSMVSAREDRGKRDELRPERYGSPSKLLSSDNRRLLSGPTQSTKLEQSTPVGKPSVKTFSFLLGHGSLGLSLSWQLSGTFVGWLGGLSSPVKRALALIMALDVGLRSTPPRWGQKG
jgi:hypothetical protein